MKSYEWAQKFSMSPPSDGTIEERYAEVLKEYGAETLKLLEDRTKFSKNKFPAAQGAIKEQKNKFRSICGLVPNLTEAMFENVVDQYVPTFRYLEQAECKKGKVQKKEENQDVKDYRNSKGRPTKETSNG